MEVVLFGVSRNLWLFLLLIELVEERLRNTQWQFNPGKIALDWK